MFSISVKFCQLSRRYFKATIAPKLFNQFCGAKDLKDGGRESGERSSKDNADASRVRSINSAEVNSSSYLPDALERRRRERRDNRIRGRILVNACKARIQVGVEIAKGQREEIDGEGSLDEKFDAIVLNDRIISGAMIL